jgi:hypothetical protein
MKNTETQGAQVLTKYDSYDKIPAEKDVFITSINIQEEELS